MTCKKCTSEFVKVNRDGIKEDERPRKPGNPRWDTPYNGLCGEGSAQKDYTHFRLEVYKRAEISGFEVYERAEKLSFKY